MAKKSGNDMEAGAMRGLLGILRKITVLDFLVYFWCKVPQADLNMILQ